MVQRIPSRHPQMARLGQRNSLCGEAHKTIANTAGPRLAHPFTHQLHIDDTPASDEDRWLTQVLQQVLQSDGDTERLEDVLDAIENQTFQVTLDLQEESDELTPSLSGQADLEEDGAWLHAMDVQRNIKVALYVSGADELETLEWRKNWKGEVAIVGLDSLSQRVLMKSIAPSR